MLETDEEGNLIYRDRGIPESQKYPDGEDFARKTSIMEETLILTQEVLLSLPTPHQEIVSQEAQHIFLTDLNKLKALFQA